MVYGKLGMLLGFVVFLVTDEQILKMILWEVRIRISRKGSFKKTRENVRICQLWNLADSVLN
jgi:hypothetical protein